MASIQAVSEAAGVSVATVSRVINRSKLVAPATKAVVHAAIRQLGYVPPPIEKRQRRLTGRPIGARKGNVALLFPDTRDDALRTSLSRRLTQGIGELLSAKSLNLIVTSLAAGSEMPQCVQDRQVDGVIVRGSGDALAIAPMLAGVPTVWLLELGEEPAQGDHVAEDNDAIGRLAAQHLIQRGHRNVVCINPQGLHPAYRMRSESFYRSANRLGGNVSMLVNDNIEVPLWNTTLWQAQVRVLVEQLAELMGRPAGMAPTALFVPLPDDMVLFVRDCLAQRGLAGRFDVGSQAHGKLEMVVCTYDPLRMSSLVDAPPQIDIHAEAIGRAAAELLLWRLRNPREPQRRVLIAPSLSESKQFDFRV